MSVVAADAPSKKATRLKAPPIVYPAKERSEFKITDAQREDFLNFMTLRSKLFLPAHVGKDGSGCENENHDRICVIKVPVIVIGDSNEYCVALFPPKVELPGTVGSNPEVFIVWYLDPQNPPAGATFTFFDDKTAVGKAPGIIVLTDLYTQLHDGALGDGSASPDATKWRIWNKHRVKGEAVYIPLIVRTDAATMTEPEKVSVCGTPDPRIAND